MDPDKLKKFDRTGTKHSEETKEKIRNALEGKKRGKYKKKEKLDEALKDFSDAVDKFEQHVTSTAREE